MRPSCPACTREVRVEHVAGGTADSHDKYGLYIPFKCSECGETLVYVPDYYGNREVLFECTWDTTPCGYDNCEYCLNGDAEEFNEFQARNCSECGYHAEEDADWETERSSSDVEGSDFLNKICPECETQYATSIVDTD